MCCSCLKENWYISEQVLGNKNIDHATLGRTLHSWHLLCVCCEGHTLAYIPKLEQKKIKNVLLFILRCICKIAKRDLASLWLSAWNILAPTEWIFMKFDI
jgi:hypothetical protein